MRLTAEHLTDPLGVNTTRPLLGWKNSGKWLSGQSAYEIVAGTDSMLVADTGKGDLWNSGKISSPSTGNAIYAGKTLAPRQQVWWKVRVWNEKGTPSPWSDVARLGIGIVADADKPLQGKYIAMPADAGDPRAPILRKNMKVDSKTGRIMAHVNSLGYHELYVNGVKASDNVLSPGVSQLGTRSLIVTYDITPLVKEGDNDVALWLGQGWYKPTTYKAEYAGPAARVEIDAVKGDKVDVLLASDESWKAAESGRHDTGTWYPLQFGGEKVDGSGACRHPRDVGIQQDSETEQRADSQADARRQLPGRHGPRSHRLVQHRPGHAPRRLGGSDGVHRQHRCRRQV